MEDRERLFTTIIFITVIGFLAIDIQEDLSHGSEIGHVVKEAFTVLLGLVGIAFLWIKYLAKRQEVRTLGRDLDQARADLKKFKQETRNLTEGLSLKIDHQLNSWQLTKAEKEVALLILKGLSNKEIAEVRQTAEKTIRQQASSVYHKSNLSGRNELSAFFLEDLLVLPSL